MSIQMYFNPHFYVLSLVNPHEIHILSSYLVCEAVLFHR